MGGLLSNPVTAIAGAALGVFTLIKGIFAHHAQAVKTEAAALNAAVPATEESWKNIFGLVNSGQLDASAASGYLDQSLAQYRSVVYDQYKVKQKSGNGPDVIFQSLSRSVEKLKALLTSGGGSAVVEKTYANAGYQGTPEFTVSYSGASSVSGSVAGVVNAAKANPGRAALVVLAVLVVLWLVAK